MIGRRGLPAGLGIALIAGLMVAMPPAHAMKPRIVGGVPVPISDAPWQVQVSIRGQELCGGSILNATTIVTAAHCVDRVRAPSDIRITAGAARTGQGGIDRRVTAININPNWDRVTFQNDIALLTLDEPLLASAEVSPIQLPDVTQPWPPTGTPATVFGWGSRTVNGSPAETLQRGDVLVMASPDDGTCGDYGGLYDPINQICAGLPQGGVDACQGDSGGALVIALPTGPAIAGVVSTGKECAQVNFPGLYARVTTYLPWIQSSVATFAMSPSAPTQVRAQSPRPGRMRVRWQPPIVDGGAAVTGYEVSIGRRTCRTATTTCVVTGLRRDATVNVRVQAINAIGAGPASVVRVRVR